MIQSVQSQPRQQAGLDVMVTDLAYFVFHHKWKIFLFSVAGILAAAYAWITASPVYRSEARLLVRYVMESTGADPAALSGEVISPDRQGRNIINSEIGILTSREIAEEVIDEIGVTRIAAEEGLSLSREKTVLLVSRNMHAESPRNSNLITVYYDAPNPRLAQDALAALTRLYLQKHLDVHRSGLAYDFLSRQTDQMASRLAETEQELRALKSEAGVVDIDRAKALLEERVVALNSQLLESERALAAAEARWMVPQPARVGVRTAQRANGGGEEQGIDPETRMRLDALRSTLAGLRRREAELLATYTAESVLVQNVRREIAKAEEEWKTVTAGIFVSREALSSTNAQDVAAAPLEDLRFNGRAEVAAMRATVDVIRRHMEEAESASALIENTEARIRQLQRKRDIEEANYLYFSKSLEQARIDDALDSGKISNISVVQKASLPLEAMRPNRMRNAGFAAAAGLLAGIALAFLTEKTINIRRFSRPSEITASLDIPVLVTIRRLSRKARTRLPSNVPAKISGSIEPGAWVPPCGFADYCDKLHHRMFLFGLPSNRTPLVGITGCSRGAGVSTIASGVAVSIAREQNMRVLVASASLDRGAEIMADENGTITIHDRSRRVIPSPGEDNTLPAIVSPVRKLREFLARLKTSEYDFVVLDLPPVVDNGVFLPIAGALDGVVVVIQAERDRRALIRNNLELLAQAQTRVLGAVLNRYRSYAPRWLSDEV